MLKRKSKFWTGYAFVLLFPFLNGYAQDSARVFSPSDLYGLLSEYHPVARQAGLLARSAEAQMRMARGAFDPKLFGGLNQKTFDGKLDYRYFDGGIKAATLLGVELKAGYEGSMGPKVNPEQVLPQTGLMVAGVSVPLGRDLLIDERRAALQQARIFNQLAGAQQDAILNDLFFAALKTYWDWAQAYARLQMQDEAVNLAFIRKNAIRTDWQFGGRPGVDTLEAFILWQNRRFGRNEAYQEYLDATYALSNFLWDENEMPLEITPALRPIPLRVVTTESVPFEDSVMTMINLLTDYHPEIQELRLSLAQLEVERRFKADRLKPGVYLDYNLINEPFFGFGEENVPIAPQIFQNNYKLGVTVDFPLFLRKERGSLALTKLKIQDTQFKQDLKLRELANKVRTYYADLGVQRDQIAILENNVDNYAALLEAEERKFEVGESSLFLLNTRENSLIESRIKLLETYAKFAKARAGLYWSAGQLGE